MNYHPHHNRNCLEKEGKEVLVFQRDYYGIKPSTTEISEEFRLINNLYYEENDKSFYSIKEDGQYEQAIRMDGEAVFIRLNYLMKYIAAKQMALVLFFDIRFSVKGSLKDNGLSEYYVGPTKEDNIYYTISGGELPFPEEIYSRSKNEILNSTHPLVRRMCGQNLGPNLI